MKRLILFFLLLSSQASASDVVMCDSTGKVSQYRQSVNGADYVNGTNLIDPNVSAVISVPVKYWKVVSGSVVEMTLAEKKFVDDLPIRIAALRTELETLSIGIEADDLSWASMTTVQRLAVAKKVIRREVLKRKLGLND